ncbi:hypothetical protein HHK36_032237 [Tetracentron sinense]|uniref:Uncharacterized protein n=1 Tax=Tetracentron sinense TaxID=13715 RepID=A0A834YAL1_TETSI|nr:hypothetical protein HHK36_032237 [Tetracentron sinense]
MLTEKRMINMEEKPLIRMLILFLGFSYVLSSGAVPLSSIIFRGSFKSINAYPSAQELMPQVFLSLSLSLSLLNDGTMELRYDREVIEVEEGFIEGRMDIESNDYPGTGANPGHDPNPPGI